jgi:drug/metabolite transporter (DMT)-like permease
MTPVLGIVLLAEFCNTIGQTLFKKSANTFELPPKKTVRAFLRFFGKVFTTPWIWLGLGAMGMGLLVWFFALSRAELSFVYPIGSTQYILVLVSARVYLNEKINRLKIIGTLFIIFGILLISRS